MRGARCRAAQQDRGAQAVEFALIFSLVLAPLLYGLIAFGFVMNDQITASQLAREVARSAAICAGQNGAVAATCNDTTSATSVFQANEPQGFRSRGGAATVDTSQCFAVAPSTTAVAIATVSVKPVLTVPLLSTINGKASTPCGG
jgi:Flp pilus assembly protein TadG